MDQFHDIYERCAEKVCRFLLGLTQSADQAEELTAETFYQAFLHIDRFRGDCAIETWLCQIAKNAFYKEQKRRKRFYPEPGHLAERDEPDGALQQLEDRQTVLDCTGIFTPCRSRTGRYLSCVSLESYSFRRSPRFLKRVSRGRK